MSASAKVPGLPRSLLRPKFWEVAADRDNRSYATPFEKHRRLEGMTPENMAEFMQMSLDKYIAFEQGKVRPSPQDILTYCATLDLHPLDLYAEPYPGIPLPAELRDALLMADRAPNGDRAFYERAKERLALEQIRGNAMVESNRDELSPLFSSFAYSSLVPEDKALAHGNPKGEREDPRGMLNSYLNAHKLVLEDEVIVQAEIHRVLDKRSRTNAAIMRSIATILYREESAGVLERIGKEIREKNNIADLKIALRRNPYLFGALAPSATEGKVTGENAREFLRERQALLLVAVNYDVRYQRILQDQTQSMNFAMKALQNFEEWRESPRTQRLLDWIENGLVLDKHLGGDHRMAGYIERNGAVPAP